MTEEQKAFIEENVRIFDAPLVKDRYSAVFMHRPQFKAKNFEILAMSVDPYEPNGVGTMTTGHTGTHLGRRISFEELPEPCQRLLVATLF